MANTNTAIDDPIKPNKEKIDLGIKTMFTINLWFSDSVLVSWRILGKSLKNGWNVLCFVCVNPTKQHILKVILLACMFTVPEEVMGD